MKRNKLTLLITLVLAIIAVVLVLNNKNFTIRKELHNFALNDTANVSKIFLADKQNLKVTLIRKSPGLWVVNNKYSVRKDAIDLLLKTMVNIAVKEPVATAAHNNIVKLLAARSVKCEIYQNVYRINFLGIKLFKHEKLTKVYYVGDATMDTLGTFMLMENSTVPFVTYLPGFRGFVSTRYTTREDDWRSHNIFNCSAREIRSVKMEFFNKPTESFMVSVDNSRQFKLVSLINNQEIPNFEAIKIMDFFTAVSNAKFETLLNTIIDKKQIDSISSSRPMSIITITDKMGKVYVAKAFIKIIENEETPSEGAPIDTYRFYMSLNDGKDFVLTQYTPLDKVMKPLSFYIKTTK